MLTDSLLLLLRVLVISLSVSAALMLFFVLTINRNSAIRTLFRIGHRISLIMIYIIPFLLVLKLLLDISLLIGVFRGGISLDFAEPIIYQTLDIGVTTVIIDYSLFLLAFTPTIHILKLNHQIQYEKYGVLSEWGERTRTFKKKIGWMPVVLDQLEQVLKPMVAQKDTLQILAPAANNGEEEYALAESLASRLKCKVRMRASDQSPMLHQLPTSTPEVEFSYDQINAYALPSVVETLQDIIYDPKGILWFSQGKEKKLLPALRLFYDLLASDGIVLIDAPDHRRYQQKMNEFRLYFGRQLKYYCEGSTYRLLQKAFKDGSAASALFTLELVDNLEGAYKMAILRKLPAAEENRNISA